MLALVAVCSAEAVGMAIGSGGNGGARWQGWHSERTAVEMVPEYTGMAAQSYGRDARTARSGSIRARSWINCYDRARQAKSRTRATELVV